ncbi:hypothetical protein A9Q87_11650 [Flavobacteriales bacterium 34_180_T64]|nr:hypothetical protein A9Q87_11650 [Flavobacteriales bacterium 34_180_T64]
MKNYYSLLLITLIFSCNSSKEKDVALNNQELVVDSNENLIIDLPVLDLDAANVLSQLPLHCMETEYPNKLNQVIGSSSDLKSPKALHPAFYGCFDWHSAVHGHWSLVSLLKQFPDLKDADVIKQKLLQNISKANIKTEVEYFHLKHNGSYERTYGWAWLLKLSEEIHTWDDPVARELERNLKPLADLVISKYLEFLPKLNYPIRVGEHTNTAFGLSFAYDYAKTTNHTELKSLIEQRARDFYLEDQGCPLEWEPSGFDFLSPCLEEAAIMKRVLPLDEFKIWFAEFLPQLKDKTFSLATGEVSDRTDGKLVHLDGVNFSRAWSLAKITDGLPEYAHLKQIAYKHINYSLPSIVGDSYEGGHWLGSFAIYALNSVNN